MPSRLADEGCIRIYVAEDPQNATGEGGICINIRSVRALMTTRYNWVWWGGRV